MDRVEKGDFKLIATIARGIWLRRNAVVFGRKFLRPNQPVKNEKEAIEDFYAIEWQKNYKELLCPDIGTSRWLVPPSQVYKINWNAALDK